MLDASARLEAQVGADACGGEVLGAGFDDLGAGSAQLGDDPRRPSSSSSATAARYTSPRSWGVVCTARSTSGSRTEATTTACRRASTGIAATSERAAASSSRSVKTTTSARFDDPDRAERELVVAVDRARLEIEDRADDRVAVAPAGRDPAPDLGVERDDAAAVAELVGHEHDRGERVERGVEPGAVADRRRHQPSGVEEAHDVAVLLDAVLVAHRPTGARRRRPVHLADVVVGLVVAHGLELGAEPERAACEQPGVAEPTAAHRGHDAARRGNVGIHDDLRVAAARELPAPQAERSDPARRDRREPVPSAPPRGDRALRGGRRLPEGRS